MQLNIVFRDWLNKCKITDKVIEDFEISGDDHIVIPVHDYDGNFSFNKYRKSPLDTNGANKYWYDNGGKVTLFAWHKAKDAGTILITEGEKDCLVAWSHNIPAVTSTGGALSFQKEWGSLFADKEVIVCLDNDSAGGEGMVKILSIIPHAKMLFLPDRAGIKDVSDYCESGGNLHELIRSAKPLYTLEAIKENRSERIAAWQSTHFHDAYIKAHEKPVRVAPRKDRIETDKVLRAKEYDVRELLSLSSDKTLCLWHSEKTPSLHYYSKTNTCYCFGGCGRAFDAIDVYRKLHNCSFNEAVAALQ